jgi:hypothetical protein
MDSNSLQPVQESKLPKWLTTVTPFSKALAMILFIVLPFVGFSLGESYQNLLNNQRNIPTEIAVEKNPVSPSIAQIYSPPKISMTLPAGWKYIESKIPADESTPPSYQKIYGNLLGTDGNINLSDKDMESSPKFFIGSIILFNIEGVVHHITEPFAYSEETFYDPKSTFWPTGLYGGGVALMHETPVFITLGGKKFIKQLRYAPDNGSFEGGVYYKDIKTYDYYHLIGNKVLIISLTFNSNNPMKNELLSEFDSILTSMKIN